MAQPAQASVPEDDDFDDDLGYASGAGGAQPSVNPFSVPVLTPKQIGFDDDYVSTND